MTFPFQPHRSSSDDELLDQHLNEWVGGSDAKHTGDVDSDPIAFHRWADETRRSEPAATGPAAGTWNRVLRQTAQPQSKGTSTMSTAALGTGYTVARPDSIRERVSRFTHLAATIALVLAVAVGGWFAMSQMPGRDGNGRFAAIQSTPGDSAQTCDVEPMTVDEVMAIVENPYKYADPEAYGSPNSSPAPWYDDYAQVQPITSGTPSRFAGDIPTSAAMDNALPVLQMYLACVETKTIAHSLRFVDPFSIQERVVTEFPFYRDQESVRNWVSEWISQGPQSLDWVDEGSGETLAFTPNINREESRTSTGWIGLGFNQLLSLGCHVLDEDGNVLARYDGTMQLVDGEKQSRFVVYTLVYSMYTDQWYVVTGWWPNEPRI